MAVADGLQDVDEVVVAAAAVVVPVGGFVGAGAVGAPFPPVKFTQKVCKSLAVKNVTFLTESQWKTFRDIPL